MARISVSAARKYFLAHAYARARYNEFHETGVSKMKKRVSSIFFGIFASLCLTGCVLSNGDDSNKGGSTVIPTYQGMTISRGGDSKASLRHKDGYPDGGGQQGEDYQGGDYQGGGGYPDDGHPDDGRREPVYDDHDHHRHDKDIENDIEDIVDLKIETDEEVKYYVKPEEVFTIEVHISNPNDYEIQSITLGGKKYANYMFTSGSTMEKIGISATAPITSGYTEYTIDAIKYIDGTEIKDVDLSKGDKSIKAGISYTEAPTAKVTSYDVGTTYLNMGINVSDPEHLIKDNPLTIYLSDGEQTIAQQDLNIGDNMVRFNNLTMSKAYQYGVATAYDFVDGKDTHQEWILSNTFTTLGAYKISGVETSKTSISFSVDRTGEVGTIDKISLYDATTSELVKEGDSSTRSFDGLLSNHSYNLYVDFSYTVNDTSISDWVDYANITTYAKVVPTLSFESSSSDKTSVKYKIKADDIDGVLTVQKVELLKNGESVAENGTLLEGSFTGLLSNADYSVKLTYTYNLNDGQGDISNFITKDIKTIAKVEPTLTLSEPTSDKTSISYNLTKDDIDGILEIKKVELLKNGTVEKENGSALSGTFTGLLSNYPYVVKATYTYNLNDGSGIKEGSVEKNVRTESKVAPTLSFTSSGSDQTSIDYSVSVKDVDGVLSIDKVELLKDGEAVKDNGSDLNGTFSDLLSGVSYSVKVSYTYDLNDGEEPRKDSIVKELSTVSKVAPTLSFDSSSSNQSEVTYSVSTTDCDEILSIDSVDLLKNGEVVKNNGSSLSGTFSDLLSDNSYSIKVSYSYDLNDGNGVVTDSISEDVNTTAKKAPSVLIGDDAITDTSISSSLKLVDEDSTGTINSVALYKGDELVADNEAKEINFSNLDSYSDYQVVVSYSYDLNDGNGLIDKTVTKDYKTSPTLEFNSCKISNTSAVSEGDMIVMQLSLDKQIGATPISAVVNGETYECTKAQTENKIFVNIRNNGQFEGGNTELTVEKVNVELDGKTYSVVPKNNNKANVFVNGVLEVVEIYGADAEGNKKDEPYYFADEDLYIGVELKNKTGYDVDKMTLSGWGGNTEYSELTKVNNDSNHWVILLSKAGTSKWGGISTMTLSSLSYSSNSVKKTLTVNKQANIYTLGEDTVTKITTKEQLLNMSEGFHCYSLQNDISLESDVSLAGIKNEWHGGEFSGVFLGNGHSITNMAFVGTHKDSDIDLGLFSKANGLVSGVNIVDATFDVDIQSSDGTSKSVVKSGFIAGELSNCSQITKCDVDADSIMDISGSAISPGYTCVAGIAGYGSWDVTITDCTNNGHIFSSESYVGGILGDSIGYTIANCANNGSVEGQSYVGGMVGGRGWSNRTQTIKDCVNRGAIEGEGCIGGISGFLYEYGSSITNCENYGSVRGLHDVGGIVCGSYSASITNCTNHGVVNGNDCVGGIASSIGGTTVKNCINNAVVTGKNSVGGIAGSSSSDSSIEGCVNNGDISGDSYIGGIAGNSGGSLKGCFNYGSVDGARSVGGIVGYMDGGSIKNCQNEGLVTGPNADGIAGSKNDDCVIEDCSNSGTINRS